MTVKIKKIFVAVLLVIALAAIAAVGFGLNASVNGAETSVSAQEYDVGDRITVPIRTLTEGGTSVSVSPIVIYPSGAAIKNGTVTLTEAGLYTVEYRAKINGKTVTEYDNFYAYNNLYSFSGEKSSAFYGADDSQYNTGKTALNVRLAQGETLTFNKIIDLNDAENGFVEFFVTPQTRGTPEVQGIYFTLTDVYDVSNTVTFQFKNVAYLGSSYVYLASYVTAGFGTEVPRAYTYDASDRVWRLRINDKFGTGTNLSLYGWAEDFGGTAIKDTYCSFALDLDTKKAYLSDGGKMKQEIIDFDEPAYFDTLWGGFTTGEVTLSVEAYDYTGQTLNINFTRVAGYDFSGGTRVFDNEAPEITVFTENYDPDDLPNGYAGKTYPVFGAYAFDKTDGEVAVDVRAYYGYDSDLETEINCDAGFIETAREGKYKLVYSAKDAFRNQVQKTLTFYVQKNPNEIEITFSGEYETACKVGEQIRVAEFSATGGSGNVEKSMCVDMENLFDSENGLIRPLETGVMTIEYQATDITGYTVSKFYTVTVSDNPNPVVLDKIVIPEYLFGGLKYQFPQVVAHDFNTESDIIAEVYVNGVKCDGGNYTPEDKKNLVVDPETGASVDKLADPYDVSLEYRAAGVSVLSKTVTVLDVRTTSGPSKSFRAEGYWVSEDLQKSSYKDGVLFSYQDAAKDVVSATFAKPIIYDSFSIGLTFHDGAIFDGFTVLLTDYENSNNTLSLGLIKGDGETRLTVNGEATAFTLSQGGFFSELGFNLRISGGKVQDGAAMNFDVSNLFSAEKVIITVKARGITAGSDFSFTVSQICDVSMTSRTTKDLIEPIVVIKGTYPAFTDKGEALDIYPAISEDLLDTEQNAVVTVTLKKNDGTTITLLSNANAFANNSVVIPDYGTVNIQYEISDGNANVRKPLYTVSVIDLTDPVITFNGKVPETVKLGATIKFGTATATDNFGRALTVKYFVVRPSVMPVLLNESMQYTTKETGIHVFRIYAEDEFGNIAIKDITFKVVK